MVVAAGGAPFVVWPISPERYEVGGHMIHQNDHLEKSDPKKIFSISGSTISVSGLRFFAFFSLLVGPTAKCHFYDPP